MLKIDRVIPKTNMVGHRTLRARARTKVKLGHALLFLNRRCTIARIIDCNGNMYCLWAPKKESFDFTEIKRLVSEGLTLDIRESMTATTKKTRRLKQVA